MVADGLVMGVMGMAAVWIVLHDVEMVLVVVVAQFAVRLKVDKVRTPLVQSGVHQV